MRQKLLLLAAVFFGVLAFIFTYQEIQNEKNKISGAAEDVVLSVLKRDMAADEIIKQGDLVPYKTQRFKNDKASNRFILWDKQSAITSRELAFSVKKDTPIQWVDLKPATRGRDGLTSIIPRDLRAISIAVDATASVTGLIQPNDHIDIIGTFRFPEMKGDASKDTLTLTILQNVVVLATGTDFGKQAAPQTVQKKNYSNVTLALSPKEAEMIIFATQKGRLALSLRNYEDTKIEYDTQSVDFSFLQKNVKKYSEEREKIMKDRSKLNSN
jgi:pilus assembly protein CpaB